MNKITSESGKIYIGMDVSQKKIEIFLLNADSAEGHFLEIPNSRDSLLAFFQAIPEPSLRSGVGNRDAFALAKPAA